MWGVTAGGPGFVAVGADGLAVAAAVWTSDDGTTWSRVPHNEADLGGDGSQFMGDVTTGGPGLVAVGSYSHLGDRAAAVWTSEDGVTWSRVPQNEAVFGGEDHHWMNAVTVGGPGLVAVGGRGFGVSDAAVWTSIDGVAWNLVEDDAFGGEGFQEMLGVAAGGPGLVAVGYTADDELGIERDAAVWTSADGVTWTRVENESGVFGDEERDQEMFDVTTGGPALVAVGQWHCEAAVWISDDGLAWSRAPSPDDETESECQRPSETFSVTTGGPGLVAVGAGGRGDEDEAAVWASMDGITWSRIPPDEGIFGGDDDPEMRGVAAAGSTVVAVGSFGPVYSELDAAVWVAAEGAVTAEDPTTTEVIPVPDEDDEFVYVEVTGIAYPEIVTVPAGKGVRFVNNSGVDHTVTFASYDDNVFAEPDPQDLGAGEVRTWPELEPGTWTYFCSIHPSMQGTLEVEG